MPDTLPHSKRKARALRWVAGPAALALLLCWILMGRAGAAARPGQDDDAAAAFAASALGPGAHQDLSKAARESAARQTQREVAEKNRDAEQDRKAFAAEGWEKVDAPPPDAKLLALDPALLDGREDELRVQMASTVARPAQAAQLAEIARHAREAQTRSTAVDALGRVGSAEAQRALFGLLGEDGLRQDDPARRGVAALLRPADLADPYARELAAQLDSRGLTAAERKQIAFTLALVGLRDGAQLPQDVLAQLSPASRELYAAMAALASQKNAR